MKLVNNNTSTTFINTDDVTVSTSQTTLTDVLNDHNNDIQKLKQNVKWLYKYGGTGSKGGSGSGNDSSDWKMTVRINGSTTQSLVNNGAKIYIDPEKNDSTLTITGEISQKSGYEFFVGCKCNGRLLKGAGDRLKDWYTGTMVNINNLYSFTFTFDMNIANNIDNLALTVINTKTGQPETITFSVIYSLYSFKIDFVDKDNLNILSNDNNIYINNTVISNNIRIKITPDVSIGDKDIDFKVYASNDLLENSIDGVYQGKLNEDWNGNTPVYITLNNNYLSNEDNLGMHTFNFEFNIPSFGEYKATTVYKKITVALIPSDRIFIKLQSTLPNSSIYKYNRDLYDNYKPLFANYKSIYESYINNEIENERNELLNQLHNIESQIYIFDSGSKQINYEIFGGSNPKTSYHINILISNNGGESFIQLGNSLDVKERETSQFIMQTLSNIYIIRIELDDLYTFDYFMFSYDKSVSINWYDLDNSSLNQTYMNYFRGSDNELCTDSYERFIGLNNIKIYANNSTDINLSPNLDNFKLTSVNDEYICIGFQYSVINDVNNYIFKLKYNDGQGGELGTYGITIYQNKIIIGNSSNAGYKIFIPMEDNYNANDNSKYHLLSIYKRYLRSSENNQKYYELMFYIDGCLETAYSNFITSNKEYFWTEILAGPSNTSINLLEMSFFNHNDKAERFDEMQSHKLSYLDDIAISEYFYKYVSFKGISNNAINSAENVFKYLRNFKELDNGMIEVYEGNITINNIAKNIDIPVLLFESEYDNFINEYTRSYQQSTEFNGWELSDLSYSPGKEELTQIFANSNYKLKTNDGHEISYRFKIAPQGSSTLNYFCKNLDLYTECAGYKILFTPNFYYTNKANNDLTENERILVKNSFLPEERFTLKADVVDSSHCNNNAVGKFVNENTTEFIVDNVDSKTSKFDKYIKNCLTGFGTLVFIYLSKELKYYFLGIMNFNLGRSSYFNLGYYETSILDDNENIKTALTNEQANGKNFIISYIPETSLENLKSELIVAEVQDNNSHWDFSQYDDTVLFPQYYDDHYAMFGDFVPKIYNNNGTPTSYSNNVTKSIKELVKHISLSGGYIFEKLGKHFTEQNNGYRKTIDDGSGDIISANAVPNYLIQYKRKFDNRQTLRYNNEIVYTVKDNILDGEQNSIIRGTADHLKTLLYGNYDEDTQNFIDSPLLDYTSLVEYYTICMAFGMVDSVMKNLNIKKFNKTYYLAFYDMDTCLGRNNAGLEIEYYSFSNFYYQKNNNTSLNTYEIYRDFWPLGIGVNGYDFPSTYLFGIAKYASLFSSVIGNDNIFETLYPENLWARYRLSDSDMNDSSISSLGQIGKGSLKNTTYFINTYFKRGLDVIPEQIWNMNYRLKYFKKKQWDSNSNTYILSNAFDNTNYQKFHGKGIYQIYNWFEKRLHILDMYFNIDGGRQIISTINYNTDNISSDEIIRDNIKSQTIKIGDIDYTIHYWEDPSEPNLPISSVKTNYNALAASLTPINSDIIMLENIFNDNRQGIQYPQGVYLAKIKAKEYSPFITKIADQTSKTFAIDPNKLYTLQFTSHGLEYIVLGGSKNWTYIEDASVFIPAMSTDSSAFTFTINSTYINKFTITKGNCNSWNLNLPALQELSITPKNEVQDSNNILSGNLNFDTDNYPNLTSIDISGTQISLNIQNESVKNIIAKNIKSDRIELLNCYNLESCIFTGATIQTLSISPAWCKEGQTIEISNTHIRNITLKGRDNINDQHIYINTDNTLESIELSNFAYIKIEKCPNLSKIIITDPDKVKSLQIIHCNTNTSVPLNLNNNEQLYNIDLTAFEALTELSFSETSGFNILNINDLNGDTYTFDNGATYNHVIRLIGPAFKKTQLKRIDSNNVYLLIDTNDNNNAVQTFSESYFGSDNLIRNNFIVSKNVTSLNKLFSNSYDNRTGGIDTNAAAIILGNDSQHQFKFIYENIDNITDLSDMFFGQNIYCTNEDFVKRLSLSNFKNVINISGIFKGCSGFQYVSKSLFIKENNNQIISQLAENQTTLKIDSFASNIDKIKFGAFDHIINKITSFTFSSGSNISIENVYDEENNLVNEVNIKELLFKNINDTNKIENISGISISNSLTIDWKNLFKDDDEDKARFPHLKSIESAFNHGDKNNNVRLIGLEYLTGEEESPITLNNALNIDNVNDPIDYDGIHELNTKMQKIVITENSLSLYKTINEDKLKSYLAEYSSIGISNLDYAFNNVILQLTNASNHELILDENNSTTYVFTSMNYTFKNFKVKNSNGEIPFYISQQTLRSFTNVTSWDYTFANTKMYKNLPLNMFNLKINDGDYTSNNYTKQITSMKGMFNNVKITDISWFEHEFYEDICDDRDGVKYIKGTYNSPLNGSYSYNIKTNANVVLTNPMCIDKMSDGINTIYGKRIVNHLILPFDIFYGCTSTCSIESCFSNSQFEGIMPDKIISGSAIDNYNSGSIINTFRNLLVIPNRIYTIDLNTNEERDYHYNLNLNNNGYPVYEPENCRSIPTYIFIPSNFINHIVKLTNAFNCKLVLPYGAGKPDKPAYQAAYFIFNHNSIDSLNNNLTNDQLVLTSLENCLPGYNSTDFKYIYNEDTNNGLNITNHFYNPLDNHEMIYGIMLPNTSKIENYRYHVPKEQNYGLDRVDFGFKYNSLLKSIFTTSIFNEALLSILYGSIVSVYDSYNKQYDYFDINSLPGLTNTNANLLKAFINLSNSTEYDVNNNKTVQYGIAKYAVLPKFTYSEEDDTHSYAISGITKTGPQIEGLNVPGNTQEFLNAYNYYKEK